MTGPRNQSERMVDAARDLLVEVEPQATLDLAVRLAVANVTGADAAAVSLVRRGGGLDIAAHVGELALRSETLQRQVADGPGASAAWDAPLVHVPDVRHEQRWPEWSQRAARELEVRSMLCVRLFTLDDALGTLSLYSQTVESFDEDARDEAIALAGHVAVALAVARRYDQLTQALDTRTLIGQASGILMERYELDASAAFNLLGRISSTTNTKLRDVAEELVRTRRLDALD